MPSTNGHGSKRAILYARVSTDEQARSGYSIPDQLKELRGHAVREGYQVPHTVHAGPLQGCAALAGVLYLLEDFIALSPAVASQGF